MRYYELKEEVRKAFDKDMAADAAIASTESSSSSSLSLQMLTPATSSSQAAGAIDPADAPALTFGHSRQTPSAGAASGQLKSQGNDIVVDDKFGVGSKRKLKSAVWDEFERVDNWKAKCIWCHKVLSACTKNGTRHLHNHLNICRSRQAKKTPKQSTSKLS
uniref:BED-type domain-containing protein n=1 Tax=Arundo donax TaxID=35708 RepID=A0A0A9C7W5_ARUDO